MQINEPMNASSRLSGSANHRSARGKTARFQVTSHIMKNPVNQEIRVVCRRLNRVERINIKEAKENPHMIQTAALIGSEGKIRFIDP